MRAVDGVIVRAPPRRDARARRRVGLRQEHDGPGHRPAATSRRRARSSSTARTSRRSRASELQHAPPPVPDDLPGPVLAPEPADDGRRRSSASRSTSTASGRKARAPRAGPRAARDGRAQPGLRASATRTSSRAASGSASASPGRSRSTRTSSSPTSRSARSTSRSRPRSSTSSSGSRAELGPDVPVHRPRPVGGPPHQRPDRGDVPRPDRRAGAVAASSTAARSTRTRSRCCRRSRSRTRSSSGAAGGSSSGATCRPRSTRRPAAGSTPAAGCASGSGNPERCATEDPAAPDAGDRSRGRVPLRRGGRRLCRAAPGHRSSGAEAPAGSRRGSARRPVAVAAAPAGCDRSTHGAAAEPAAHDRGRPAPTSGARATPDPGASRRTRATRPRLGACSRSASRSPRSRRRLGELDDEPRPPPRAARRGAGRRRRPGRVPRARADRLPAPGPRRRGRDAPRRPAPGRARRATPAGCPRSCRSSRSRPTTGCSSPRPCSRTARSAHVHRKVFLPTYGLFDERRFFAAGRHAAGRRRRGSASASGIGVCEDFWHLPTPQLLALDGAQILINVSSSPGRDLAATNEVGLGTATSWRALMRTYAQLTTSFVVFCNRVGVDESITFWGGSEVIAPTGDAVFSAPMFDEGLFYADIDLADVRRERIALPLLRDERPGARAARAGADRRRAGGRWPSDATGRAGGGGRLRRRDRPRRRAGSQRQPDRACSSCPTSSRSTPTSRGGSSRSSSAASCARRASSGRCWACRAASTRRSSRTSSPRRSAPEQLLCVLMPYRTSSPASRGDAEEVVAAARLRRGAGRDHGRWSTATSARRRAGRRGRGLEAAPLRRGNFMARMRMSVAVRPVGHVGRARRRAPATRPSR